MGKFVATLVGWRYRSVVFVSLIVMCINCVDPYSPNIDRFESLLVVDALITDEDAPNCVKLSRSSQFQGLYAKVTGAVVVVSDDMGNNFTLTEKDDGEYWTDPAIFRGEVGKSYTLSITTPDGEEFVSNSCLMYPAVEIDSIYYGYFEAIPEGYSEPYEGINIYVDSPAESVSGYRRWIYDEWWKFRIPYPVYAEYINDSTILPVNLKNDLCWSHNSSSNINIHHDGTEDRKSLRKTLAFFPSQLTNRFQMQYSIEVKQLSISREEYEFWSSMKLLNETGGNIFDRQPYSVVGNVRNLNNPSKHALGYFQVSAVSVRQMYITSYDIWLLGLSRYRYGCDKFTTSPADYLPIKVSWDYVFNMARRGGYTFVSHEADFNGNLTGLTFVMPHCADCTLNGQLDPPVFWEDL